MKKLTLSISAIFAIALAAEAEAASSYEYKQLYKDPKSMGMGGTGVASGGSFGAMFNNPAGLTRIPKEYGWEFQVLGISAAINENALDLQDIVDSADDDAKIAEELDKHIGDHFHFDMGVVPFSIAKMFDETAFALGTVASANFSATAHQGFGSQGVLDVDAVAVGGAAAGIAHDFNDLSIGGYALNRLTIGVGAKVLQYGYITRQYSAADIANEEFDNIDDDLEEGSSIVGDLGVIYDIFPNISVGFSALNIGGIADDTIPMTLNAGVSYVYRISNESFFNQVRASADYIDISREYTDSSYMKRLRIGADLNVWDGSFSTFAVQAGFYQGSYTAGANLRLAIVDLSFATYAEELGAYSGQDSDRRYVGSFGFSW